MHSNVTIKNVSWPHFSWPTLYVIFNDDVYYSCDTSSSLTVLLLHHHQLLFLHVRESNERVVNILREVLVGSVLAAQTRGRCDLSTEATDVKCGQRLLRLNAVER